MPWHDLAGLGGQLAMRGREGYSLPLNLRATAMGILADFGDFLVHEIRWERVASVSDDGTPSFDAPRTFAARVDFKRSSLVSAQGDLVGTRGTVIVGGTPIVRPGDRITLPDGSQPPILDASVTDDENGAPYVTLITLG